MTTWKKKLTKKQLKHLSESKIHYKWQLEDQKTFMKKELEKHPQDRFVCYDCINILRRLEMWEDSTGIMEE